MHRHQSYTMGGLLLGLFAVVAFGYDGGNNSGLRRSMTSCISISTKEERVIREAAKFFPSLLILRFSIYPLMPLSPCRIPSRWPNRVERRRIQNWPVLLITLQRAANCQNSARVSLHTQDCGQRQVIPSSEKQVRADSFPSTVSAVAATPSAPSPAITERTSSQECRP